MFRRGILLGTKYYTITPTSTDAAAAVACLSVKRRAKTEAPGALGVVSGSAATSVTATLKTNTQQTVRKISTTGGTYWLVQDAELTRSRWPGRDRQTGALCFLFFSLVSSSASDYVFVWLCLGGRAKCEYAVA